MLEFAVLLITVRKFKSRSFLAEKADNLVKVKPISNVEKAEEVNGRLFHPNIKVWGKAFATDKDVNRFCYNMDKGAMIVFSTTFTIFHIVYVVVYSV